MHNLLGPINNRSIFQAEHRNERLLKICWAGWTGGEFAEVASGILPIDPDPTFYVLGSGTTRDEAAFYHGFGRRISYFVSPERFFADLATDEYDVLIHNTYLYSSGHRWEIYPLGTHEHCITNYYWWDNVRAFKILHDGESFTQLDFYKRIVERFDAVITYNTALKEHCDSLNIPCFLSFVCCPSALTDPGLDRDIAVSYTGSNLGVDYRGAIKAVLHNLPERYPVVIEGGAFSGLPVDQWVNLLNRSKIHQCTHSCPTGSKYPMHVKNREAKGLLCGALPVIENYPPADAYLTPGKEKIVFNNLEDLRDILLYYLDHDDERMRIVEAGKKKIRENFTCDIMFQRAFQAFGLLPKP